MDIWLGSLLLVIGTTVGFGVMALVERLFPHEHSTMGQESILPLKRKKLTLSLQDITGGLGG